MSEMRKRPRARSVLDMPSVPSIESLSGALVQALKRADQGLPLRAKDRTRLLAMGLIRKVPDRFSTPTSSGHVILAGIRALATTHAPMRGNSNGDEA